MTIFQNGRTYWDLFFIQKINLVTNFICVHMTTDLNKMDVNTGPGLNTNCSHCNSVKNVLVCL